MLNFIKLIFKDVFMNIIERIKKRRNELGLSGL